jgi:NAD(P)H-flavin reductase
MRRLIPKRARIVDIRSETPDIKTYRISVRGSFHAVPGQFNMVGYPGVGEAPISLSSIVNKNCFDHTIRAVGKVTGFLDRFKKGDEIFLRGPYGRGWPVDKAKGKDVLLVAGGVGLAPLRPVIQIILGKRNQFDEVSLIYGARNEMNVLFLDELETWAKRITVYLTVDEVIENPGESRFTGGNLSRPRFAGRRNKGEWKYNVGLVTDLLDRVKMMPDNACVFACGPEIMMRFVCRGLIMQGIPQSRLYVSMERRMKCGIAQCGHCQHFGLFVCKDGPVFSYNEVKGLPDGLL